MILYPLIPSSQVIPLPDGASGAAGDAIVIPPAGGETELASLAPLRSRLDTPAAIRLQVASNAWNTLPVLTLTLYNAL